MASLLVRTLLVATICLFIYARHHPYFDTTVHRISDLDLSLDLPPAGYEFGADRDHHGHYSSDTVDQFCKHHGYQTFRPQSKSGQRKVYDLFMVNKELDWLEVRLNTMYNFVDYFVIVESSKTFTGQPKPLTIKDNLDKFSRFRSKIIYHELEYPADFNPQRTWDWEDLQRNAMYTQVFPKLKGNQAPNRGDVIIVADVDEIVRPATLLVLRSCEFPRRLTLRSRFYYYSFQFLHRGPEWEHPQATFYDGSRTVLPANLRTGDGGFGPIRDLDKADLWNACWHCSSCFGTVDEFLNKMSSFSHKWMNGEQYRDRHKIADAVREGRDLWGRSVDQFDRVDNNTDVPTFLKAEPNRFRYMLSRDGPSAGFLDYQGKGGRG